MGFLDFPHSLARTGRRLTNELALSLITLVAVCWCLVYVAQPNVWSFVFRSLTYPALLVAANSMLLATAARVWRQRNEPTTGTQTVMALPAIGALSLLFCIVLRWEIFGYGQHLNFENLNFEKPYFFRMADLLLIPRCDLRVIDQSHGWDDPRSRSSQSR
jgi:hypothetical protein